jgi:hypothetical protein
MFQPQFEKPILDGRKGSTIRKTARCKEGDVLSLRLWTGKPYRSSQYCMMQVACQAIAEVRIYSDRISLDGMVCTESERDAIVRREGFGSWKAMRDWFQSTHGLPFSGEMIIWIL